MDSVQIGLVGILGTLFGVVLSSLFNLLNTRQIQKFENRKHRREVAMKLGLDYWNAQIEFVKYVNAKFGTPASVPPPDSYILHMMKLVDMAEEGELDRANIREKLSELSSFTYSVDDIVRANDDARRKEKGDRHAR